MSTERLAHSTDIPCPEWCSRPPGHPFGYGLAGDCFHRSHCADLGDIDALDLTLTIEQMELAASPAGPVEHEPISVCLGATHPGPYLATVEPGQLRQLAAALILAADLAAMEVKS